MSVWNVFDSDAFSLNSLTAAINHVPYTPGLIGDMGIFNEDGISTLTALIEEENGVLSLIDVAPRNAPGKGSVSARAGETRHVAHACCLRAL